MRMVLRDQGTTRRLEVTVDGRHQRDRADDLEAEVDALRAEVRRLRASSTVTDLFKHLQDVESRR